MTDHQERLISHKELVLVTIRCGKEGCGAELTFDLRNEEHCKRLGDDRYAVTCQLCRTDFDRGLREAVRRLCEWYWAMQYTQHEIIFRVPYS